MMRRFLGRGALAVTAAGVIKPSVTGLPLRGEAGPLGCARKDGFIPAPGGALRPSYILRCPHGAASASSSSTAMQRLGTGALEELDLATLWATGLPQRQDNRFARGPFKVFDTDQRQAIRQQLWVHATATLARNNPEEVEEAYVTGVGGNGKSHNLALFVHQARQAGAAVAYIHDMQTWLRDSRLVMKELCFAATNAAVGEPVVKRLQEMYKELDANGWKAVRDATTALRGTCTAKGVPFIIVIDQDNRLHSIKADRPLQFEAYDRMIISMKAHLIVLGASANNEGWDRRKWPNRIEHYPEPVPSECRAELFPMTQANADVKQMLEVEFNNYPLMLGVAEREIAAGKRTRAEVMKVLAKQITNKNSTFQSQVAGANDKEFRLPRLIRTTELYLDKETPIPDGEPILYDRNLAYVVNEVEGESVLRGIFPLATRTARNSLFKDPRPFLNYVERSVDKWKFYELLFEFAGKETLVPAGLELEVKLLRKAFLQPADLVGLQSNYTLFKNTPKGQCFDFVLLVRREESTWLTFYQLTINEWLRPSHEELFAYQGFLKSSIYDRCLANV